jgi:hypothetical protein
MSKFSTLNKKLHEGQLSRKIYFEYISDTNEQLTYFKCKMDEYMCKALIKYRVTSFLFYNLTEVPYTAAQTLMHYTSDTKKTNP